MVNTAKNKHCLRIEAIYEGKNFIYVVNNLVQGGELLDYVFENIGSIEDEDALRIIYSLCHSLVFLKSQGIVHRDIKPSNILMREENVVSDLVLIDFG